MDLFRKIAASPHGFTVINYAVIVLLYSKIAEPLPFFLVGSGTVLVGFGIRRLIGRFIEGF